MLIKRQICTLEGWCALKKGVFNRIQVRDGTGLTKWDRDGKILVVTFRE